MSRHVGLDARDRHQADVLRECGVGEGVEDPAQDGAHAVGPHAVGELARCDLLVDDLADGHDVAGGLGHDHQGDDDHRDDGADVEARHTEIERLRYSDPGTLPDAAPIGHAEGDRDQGAEDESHEHRHPLDRRRREPFEQDDQQQGAESEGDRFGCAEVLALVGAAAEPSGGNAHQRHPDDEDDRAGDQWWKESDQPTDDRRHQDHEHAAGDHRTVDRGDAMVEPDRDHRPDRGKRDALHQGRRTPNRQNPTACSNVAMPATNRSAVIRWTISSERI